MGYGMELAKEIVRASDLPIGITVTNATQAMRQDLLEACGLPIEGEDHGHQA